MKWCLYIFKSGHFDPPVKIIAEYWCWCRPPLKLNDWTLDVMSFQIRYNWLCDILLLLIVDRNLKWTHHKYRPLLPRYESHHLYNNLTLANRNHVYTSSKVTVTCFPGTYKSTSLYTVLLERLLWNGVRIDHVYSSARGFHWRSGSRDGASFIKFLIELVKLVVVTNKIVCIFYLLILFIYFLLFFK